MMEAQPNWFQRLLLRKRSESRPVWGYLGIGVHVEVAQEESPRCGSLDELEDCITELRMSSTEEDFARLAKRYSFPIEFLKKSFELTSRYDGVEKKTEIENAWKDEAITILRDEGYHVEDDLVKVDTFGLYYAIWELHAEDKWDPIFRRWQDESEAEFQREVRHVERTNLIMFAINTVAAAAFGLSYWSFNAGIISLSNLVDVTLGAILIPTLMYLVSLLFRKPEMKTAPKETEVD